MGAEWSLALGTHAPLHALAWGLLAFAAAFGSALLAILLARRLPDRRLAEDSRKAVRVSLEVLSMLVALVLGLMIADAKDTFDSQSASLRRLSAQAVLLDRILEEYGSETAPARAMLRQATQQALARLEVRSTTETGVTLAPRIDMHAFVHAISTLPEPDALKRTLRERAIHLVGEIGQQRLELYVQQDQGMPPVLLGCLLAWVAILFGFYGLLAPPGRAGVLALAAAATGIAAAIFLVEELAAPLDGLIRLSPAPLRDAVNLLGR